MSNPAASERVTGITFHESNILYFSTDLIPCSLRMIYVQLSVNPVRYDYRNK